MLAPQRGLIATAQNKRPRPKLSFRSEAYDGYDKSLSHPTVERCGANPRFPELSNFYCLPGRAGGSLIGLVLRLVAENLVLRRGHNVIRGKPEFL